MSIIKYLFSFFSILGIFLFVSCAPPSPVKTQKVKFCSKNEDCPKGQRCYAGACMAGTSEKTLLNQEQTKEFHTSKEPIAEQSVEKTPELLAEQTPETIAEKTSEKSIEQTPETIAEKTSEKSIEQTPETIAENPPEDASEENLPEKIIPEQPHCCQEGATRPCYTGPAKTKGKGICKAGTQTCRNCKWSRCEGEITPLQKEVCNGKDDDCDGDIDEGIKCDCLNVNDTQDCYEGKPGTEQHAPCKKGIQHCTPQHKWGKCEGQILPKKEICNGKDDDCDGKVDNGFPVGKSCTVGKGACKHTGKLICNKKGDGTICDGHAGPPMKESCNNIDDDCDGQIDEGLTQTCTTKLQGPCHQGKRTCTKGTWGRCISTVSPKKELCNNVDDDCDGKIDEDFSQKGKSCQKGQGECQAQGTFVCSKDGKNVVCNAKVGKPHKEICDGKDNDCDGKVDEDHVCACKPGEERRCYTGPKATRGRGECKDGKQKCQQDKTWGPCKGQVLPKNEICNGKDDNCNGQIDEGVMKTFYLDKDYDGYGDKNNFVRACWPPPRGHYITRGGDCDDNNYNINPGQRRFFTYPRKNGSYDYNCDGKEEGRYHVKPFKSCDSNCQGRGYKGKTPKCGEKFNYVECGYSWGGRCQVLKRYVRQACR